MKNKIFTLTAFAISMAFLESAVVVYLRKIYYPNGFDFPLIPIDQTIATTEFVRELATLIMMIGVAMISGNSKNQKFGIFIFIFGIWDLFYYVFLKLILNWPLSFNTWDILFLIPVPWVGPVWAPILLSCIMIVFGYFIIKKEEKSPTHIKNKVWILLILGSFISIVAFTWDYFAYKQNQSATQNSNSFIPNFNDFSNYVPTHFNAILFLFGLTPIIIGITKYILSTKHLKP